MSKRVVDEKESEAPAARRRGSYSGVRHPEAVREALASVGRVLQNEHKFSEAKVLDVFRSAGFDVKQSTYATWMSNMDEKGSLSIQPRGGDRNTTLNEDDIQVLCGWALYTLKSNLEVHLENTKDAIFTLFGETVSLATAGAYLHRAGFSPHTVKERRKGYTLSGETQQTDYIKFIDGLREMGFFKAHLRVIFCADFIYTSHRTLTRTTFSPAGHGQPELIKNSYTATHCIVTCYSLDGTHSYPPTLFTTDWHFQTDPEKIGNRSDHKQWHVNLMKVIKDLGLDPQRVQVLPGDSDSGSKYTRESAAILRIYFSVWGVPENARILTDGGGAFMDQGEDVLKQCGFKMHATFPSDIHHMLSVCDNKAHAVARALSNMFRSEFNNDVLSSLRLVKLLGDISAEDIHRWSNRNLSLEETTITPAVAALALSRDPKDEVDYFSECLRAYYIHKGQDARGDVKEGPDNLGDSLDGLAWEPKAATRRNTV